jgi:hypothetical protein
MQTKSNANILIIIRLTRGFVARCADDITHTMEIVVKQH